MEQLRILKVIIAYVFFAGIIFAQQNPAISKEYSNEEITQMIKTYKTSNSRDAIPPTLLQQRFQTDFSKAYDVEWEVAGNIYEVEFDIQDRDYKAYYHVKGNLLMYIQEINGAELPAMVRNAAENKYPKYRLDNVDKIRRGTEVLYSVEMEDKSSDLEVKLLLKDNGSILEETFNY
ncbi:MAG: PepSY-like domain-containing protein [Bacteroidales bacterium]|jgi:hypothetical protein|nr:PepSY-like domain-containing protein [Bacteroidales bacterium]